VVSPEILAETTSSGLRALGKHRLSSVATTARNALVVNCNGFGVIFGANRTFRAHRVVAQTQRPTRLLSEIKFSRPVIGARERERHRHLRILEDDLDRPALHA
jgi:hypothetical protein